MADPITDYRSLMAAVEEYLARPDLREFFPVFIQQAEGRLNARLKVVDMHRLIAADLAASKIDVPADFIDWVSAEWTSPPKTPQRPLMLRYVEADSPEIRAKHRPNGPPQIYTVLAGKVRVVPASSGTLELVYFARIPALTAAQPMNWLITKAPDVYLYGVLLEAMLFQKDEANAAQWLGLLNEKLGGIFGQGDTQKTASRPAKAAVEAAEVTAKAVA